MELSDYPEKYWHCLIATKEKGARPSVINDATLKYIYEEIIEPWHQKRPFTITGTIIHNTSDIKSIRIVRTDEPQQYYAHIHNNNMRANGIADMATDRRTLPFNDGQDYTNDFLFKNTLLPISKSIISGNKVFIVHGHDEQVRETIARFVEKLGLEAIILHEQANGGRTIIEKFEKYSDVAFSIVLLTPDDFGGSKQKPKIVNDRARQNVIFELGFFIGKYGRTRVCALLKDNIEYPSDYSGVIYINIDINGAWKLQLAKEMKQAGLSIDLNKVL